MSGIDKAGCYGHWYMGEPAHGILRYEVLSDITQHLSGFADGKRIGKGLC